MVIIGLDPGITGGIAVLDTSAMVFRIPTRTIQKKGKSKKDYDSLAISGILRRYVGHTDIAIFQEATHAMPQNGSVSSYAFGRGAGILEGICAALGFTVTFVSPQTWKKDFDGLIVPRLSKEQSSKMTKKEIAKHKRLAKASAKTMARELAAKLYPEISGELKQVNSDGLAESLLIAHYGRNQINRNKDA